MMREYAKCGKCGWVHVVITRDAAVDSAAGLDGHLHCQRCGASAAGFVPASQADVPRLTLVRGIVLLSLREQLKAAVQVGLDDSAARRFREFDSKEALSTHLKMLSKKE